MDTEVAQDMAEHALGFFGFYNRIIDNTLEPTDRNLFYMFQDYDLLTTESEETTFGTVENGAFTTGNSSPICENVWKPTCSAISKKTKSTPSPTSTPRTGQASGPEKTRRSPPEPFTSDW